MLADVGNTTLIAKKKTVQNVTTVNSFDTKYLSIKFIKKIRVSSDENVYV